MGRKQKTLPVIEAIETKQCDCAPECTCGDKCECTKESKCCSSCTCGDSCKCGSSCGTSHKSCCKTFAKCFTTLLGALMISASIFIVGLETAKPRPATHTMPNIDMQITKYLRNNGALVAQILEEQRAKIEEARKAEEAKARKAAEEERARKVAEYKDKIIADKTNYSLGNPNGKYVIIEFFDHRCGWCKKTNAAIWAEIDAKKAPNIRWIPIDSPIFGEGSAIISRYVLAAGKQGKYVEMHHAVAKAEGNLDKEALIALAKPLGLDINKLNADAESEEIKNKIAENIKLSQEIGVSGVPFMIVNGKPHGGALLNQNLANAIKESNEMK